MTALLFAVSLAWPALKAKYSYRGRHRAGEALGSCNQQPRWNYATELWAHVGVT
jgi:hypothetical protein